MRRTSIILVLALAACSKKIQDQAQQSSGGLGDPALSASAVPVIETPPPPTATATGTAPGIGIGPTGSVPAALSIGEAPPHFGPPPKGKIQYGVVNVTGRLPAEVVQRIVRQNLNRFRACYESGLAHNAKLAGKVVTRFVIAQEGTVSSSTSEPDTTITDTTVVTCVVDGFKKLSFPTPEGGIVTVVYPLTFSPNDE